MSELQATPSYKTLPEFDDEPTPKQIMALGLKLWTFDDRMGFPAMVRDTALYLRDKKPGDKLDPINYGIRELARFGPTGYVYEVGHGSEDEREFFAGPMINRPAGVLLLNREPFLPGACQNAVVHIETNYGEHRYLLLKPLKPLYLTLAEWSLVSVPVIYEPAVTRTSIKAFAYTEGWSEGVIGHALHPDRLR